MSQDNSRDSSTRVEAIRQTIKGMIVNDLDANIKLEQIGDNVSLLEKGLALGSVVIVKLISLLQNRFKFRFSDEDKIPEIFDGLTKLSEFVAGKTS